MRFFRVRHIETEASLIEGLYPSLAACVEDAVRDGVDLSGADFRGMNLMQADLDGLHAQGAVFDRANLGFANLSECSLDGCSFLAADLQSACLCQSMVRDCDFTGALMDGADIAAAMVIRCRFSTWSGLKLNFSDALSVEECLYAHEVSAIPCRFNRAPIVVTGFDRPIAIFDSHVQLGGLTMPMPAARLDNPLGLTERHSAA